jgi:hypothetical protein
LFVTDPGALAARIGPAAASIVNAIRSAGYEVVTGSGVSLQQSTRALLNTRADIAGVVLVGGYSVVPAEILNTLPRELTDLRIGELDDFTVWSDDGYGDRDGD